LQLNQKEKEGELAQKEAHIRKLDGQLSQVKTNKEYSALQQEIASLKADNSLLEEEVIRILDEIEAAQEEVKKETERLKQCQKDYEAKEAELSHNEQKMNEAVAQLKKQREEIVRHLAPEVKDLYERIVVKKSGIALVKVQGEVCGACQMQLRPQLINEIRMAEGLVLCENCSRILYFED
ncbi:MAG TPA: C4-type zinc ribbon domain-containing protein, partial [bacterium]|nr:C4-type zinc ribbon domain-containing protein [bacterium]